MFKLGVDAALAARVDQMRKKMRPGDILNTAPRRLSGIVDNVYKPISRAVQNTDFGHSAIYEGRGQVIEARAGAPVRRMSLYDVAHKHRFRILRLKGVTTKERHEALKHVRKQIDKPFSISALAVGGLKPTFMSGDHERRRQRLNDIFCSSMIANAYPRQAFNEKRQISDTRPSDILKSRLVKRIGELR